MGTRDDFGGFEINYNSFKSPPPQAVPLPLLQGEAEYCDIFDLCEIIIILTNEESMKRKSNEKLVILARNLRKNMTKEERKLWYDFLSGYPIRFYRQKILGKYIADFYSSRANLVIELDGAQHYEDTGMIKDHIRTEYLKEYNIQVIRIPNNEINSNFDEVCLYIDNIVKKNLEKL